MIRFVKLGLILFISAMVICILSGCFSSNHSQNVAVDTDLASYLDDDESGRLEMNNVKNSNTNKILTQFDYLWSEKSNNKSAKKCKASDAVTLYIKNHVNDRSQEWLIDIKSGTLYYDVAPYSCEDIEDYSVHKTLDKKDLSAILETLKIANTAEWKENYFSENEGTGSFSWDIIIEYKNGVIEKHFGRGLTSAPKGFHNIVDLLDTYVLQ